MKFYIIPIMSSTFSFRQTKINMQDYCKSYFPEFYHSIMLAGRDNIDLIKFKQNIEKIHETYFLPKYLLCYRKNDNDYICELETGCEIEVDDIKNLSAFEVGFVSFYEALNTTYLDSLFLYFVANQDLKNKKTTVRH